MLSDKKDPAFVKFRGIVKRFGNVTAVENMDLDIPEGALVTLLGPSGCGKTTLLRIVAGLETPTEGDIFIKGKRINDTPIHKRNSDQNKSKSFAMSCGSLRPWVSR
jgi:putative spermidine/putrescine transport system ATP-binding protein/spermidine/putrescine transport system ATP-binding protein